MNYMKLCKHCRSEIDAAATTCPVCHKQQGLTKGQRNILLFLGIPFILFLIMSWGSEDSIKDEKNTVGGDVVATKDYSGEVKDILNEIEGTEDLSIVGEVEFIREKYSTYFTGIVKNNTDDDMRYAQIEFSLYDKDGNLLGSAWDNISNLKAGGTWKFKASSYLSSELEKTIDTWELVEIEGY